MADNMSDIRLNEMIEENQKLRECLNVLLKYKIIVDLYFKDVSIDSNSVYSPKLKELTKESEEVFAKNYKTLSHYNQMVIKTSKENVIIRDEKEVSLQTNTSQNSTEKLITNSNKNQKSVQKKSITVQKKTVVGKYFCDVEGCNFWSLKASHLKIHQRKHSNVIKTIEGFKCSSCYQRFKKESSLEKHKLMHKNQTFICDFVGCGKQYSNSSSLKVHKWQHLKKYICGYEGCSYRTGVIAQFRDHEFVHKNVCIKCDICQKTFATPTTLSIHAKSVHIPEQNLMCGIDGCQKTFTNSSRLSSHKRGQHFTEKKFLCDFPNCGSKFINSYFLQKHKTKHSSERPFVCTVEGCPKKFKTQDSLNLHINVSHNAQRNYRCEHEGCGKTFKTERYLRRHETVHSDIKYSCDWPGCEYQTKWEESLRTHSKQVHSSERNFICDWPQCGKRFKIKPHLDNHLRIHTSDKRYVCHWPGCQYRCVYSGNLSKHMRVHKK